MRLETPSLFLLLAGCASIIGVDKEYRLDGDASGGSGGTELTTTNAAGGSAGMGGAPGGTDSTGGGGNGGNGGDGGKGGNGGNNACSDPGALGSGTCPASCTSCEAGVCIISCSGCQNSDIICPDDWPCEVRCLSFDACGGHTPNAIIQCPSNRACTVLCSDERACHDRDVVCPANAPCDVQCANMTDTCENMLVTCGSADCTGTCTSAGDPDFQGCMGGSCMCGC